MVPCSAASRTWDFFFSDQDIALVYHAAHHPLVTVSGLSRATCVEMPTLELHPTVLLDYPVTGDVERRLAQAIPATATSTPTTLASCGTRIAPSQKLSSRSASMAKRPTE